MKTYAISSFKAQALKIIDQVSKSHKGIVITKHGKPIVEVIPYTSSKEEAIPGKLSHTFIEEKDIVEPLGEGFWEAAQ
jgi:prevent-host-death family protein